MKWLFLLLLMVNAAIFAWGYQREQAEKHPAIEAGADVGNMRLIGEVAEPEKQNGTPETTEQSEVVIAKAEQPDQAHTQLSEIKQEQTDTPVAAPATEKEIAPEAQVAAEPEPKSESVAVKEDIKAKQEKAPEQQVAALDTQSEKPAQEKMPEEKTKPKKKPGTISRCGVIGPLSDRQVAKGIMEDLKNSELEAKLEREIEKQQIGYWVVIPPLEDGGHAQAKIDELAQAGLKDIWHFRGGGMKNAISLGMFAKKENAEKFSEEISQKGFKTEMRPRYLNKTRYLVKFTIAKSKTVTENMWQDVEKKYSRMQFSEQACESVATK